jgi:type III secretion system FlhB-like substrate exporter
VVVTNPTHYAVALAYEQGQAAPPRIVAKGVDAMAARIREAAAEHGVPIVPNPPLARALWRLEVDTDVPAEHWQAVAEIIAFVLRLRRPRGGVTRGSARPIEGPFSASGVSQMFLFPRAESPYSQPRHSVGDAPRPRR